MKPLCNWDEIDTVLLDLDGTLLDKHFDDHFWEHHVPRAYAKKRKIATADAVAELMGYYRSVEDSLAWSNVDYWSKRLQLDIIGLKEELSHLITVHPRVPAFLEFLRQEAKPAYLVTAAHPKTLALKMHHAGLEHYFRDMICAEHLALPKQDPLFWRRLQVKLGFSPERTMLADDTEKVLTAAEIAGIGTLVHIARPSSRTRPRSSDNFISITHFGELLKHPHNEICS
jgi:HAD superfamily hydrolase (TIGR01509 family)